MYQNLPLQVQFVSKPNSLSLHKIYPKSGKGHRLSEQIEPIHHGHFKMKNETKFKWMSRWTSRGRLVKQTTKYWKIASQHTAPNRRALVRLRKI